MRRQAAIPLEDLARLAGLEPDRLAEIEEGRAAPALSDVAVLAQALGRAPAELVDAGGFDRNPDARIEAKLRRLERACSSTADLIAVVDRDLRYVMVNDAYPRVLGISRDEIIGTKAGLLATPELFEAEAKPRLLRCLAGESFDWEGGSRTPAAANPCFAWFAAGPGPIRSPGKPTSLSPFRNGPDSSVWSRSCGRARRPPRFCFVSPM
jgi:PAS domain-containing protein